MVLRLMGSVFLHASGKRGLPNSAVWKRKLPRRRHPPLVSPDKLRFKARHFDIRGRNVQGAVQHVPLSSSSRSPSVLLGILDVWSRAAFPKLAHPLAPVCHSLISQELPALHGHLRRVTRCSRAAKITTVSSTRRRIMLYWERR